MVCYSPHHCRLEISRNSRNLQSWNRSGSLSTNGKLNEALESLVSGGLYSLKASPFVFLVCGPLQSFERSMATAELVLEYTLSWGMILATRRAFIIGSQIRVKIGSFFISKTPFQI